MLATEANTSVAPSLQTVPRVELCPERGSVCRSRAFSMCWTLPNHVPRKGSS